MMDIILTNEAFPFFVEIEHEGKSISIGRQSVEKDLRKISISVDDLVTLENPEIYIIVSGYPHETTVHFTFTHKPTAERVLEKLRSDNGFSEYEMLTHIILPKGIQFKKQYYLSASFRNKDAYKILHTTFSESLIPVDQATIIKNEYLIPKITEYIVRYESSISFEDAHAKIDKLFELFKTNIEEFECNAIVNL